MLLLGNPNIRIFLLLSAIGGFYLKEEASFVKVTCLPLVD